MLALGTASIICMFTMSGHLGIYKDAPTLELLDRILMVCIVCIYIHTHVCVLSMKILRVIDMVAVQLNRSRVISFSSIRQEIPRRS